METVVDGTVPARATAAQVVEEGVELEPLEEYSFGTRSRWDFYRSLASRYWKLFLGMMALVSVYAALTSARVAAAGLLLDVVRVRYSTDPGQLLPHIEKVISRFVAPGWSLTGAIRGEPRTFVTLLASIFGVFALAAGVMAVSYYYKEYLAQSLIVRMEGDLRKSLFQHLTRQSVSYFNRQRSGDLISRLTNDVSAVRLTFKLFFETVVQEPLTIFFALLGALFVSPLLFVLTIPFYGFQMIPVFRSGRKVIKHGKGRLEKLGLLTEAIQQLFTGIRIVKAFGMERHEEVEFADRNERMARSTVKMTRAKVKGRSLQEFLYNIGSGAAILVGVALMAFQLVDWVLFGIFCGLMVTIYTPLKALLSAWNQLQESRGGLERLLEILREKPMIVDKDGSLDFPGVKDEIRFENVCFSYGELDPGLVRGEEGPLHLPVLHDISFAVRTGEVVALVGPSGAGKSTIADLIARFYDPQKGRIAVDGVDIREYRFASYIQAVAIVSQDPFLFHTTIRDNIRYGRKGATDAEVEEAAKVAFAHDFILEQPQGYDTVIGERGVKLSGGQRQRITIARAILKNAPILILDEATSALDSQAEKEVQRAIDNLIRSRTTFIIAHRLSTIAHADRIIVLEDGRIAETGRHEDLLALKGKYWQLWRAQTESDSESDQ